ncbi:hypothetical protein [Stutzerimonas kunmingensis]|uniref:hypothetical protein n=1 Tax=Stutzerimonas kunmingensis TaxID=1211807 RepID=UPI0028B011D9|nr:hypothetical protein [Stutzerimonas kunmingensis]
MIKRGLTIGIISSILIASPAMLSAQENSASENPYISPDGSWISLSGTVTSVAPENFTLDYGSGLITVEMDD